MTTNTKTTPKALTLSPATMGRLTPRLRLARRALRRAGKRIDDTGLAKGAYVRDVKIDGKASVRCCSLGAINEGVSAAFGVKIPKTYDVDSTPPWSGIHRVPGAPALEAARVKDVCHLLYAAAAKRLYPRAFAARVRGGMMFSIPTFNDTRGRSAGQVAAVLDEAAMMAWDLTRPQSFHHKSTKAAVAAVAAKVHPAHEGPWTTVEA